MVMNQREDNLLEIPQITLRKIDPMMRVRCRSHSDIGNLPQTGGVYVFYGEDSEILYVGKASNLRDRVRSHIAGRSNTYDVYHHFSTSVVYEIEDPAERDMYETYIINSMKPLFNIGKVFSYSTSRHERKYKSASWLRQADVEQAGIDRAYEGFCL